MTSTLNYMLTATGLNIQLGSAIEFVASSNPAYPAVVAAIKAGGTEADVRTALDGGGSLKETQEVSSTGDGTVDNAAESRLIDVEIGYQNVYGGYAGQTKDGDFDVFGDEAFLASFESYETALDYAKGVAHRYDQMTVEDADGEVLATLNDGGVVEHVVKIENGSVAVEQSDAEKDDEQEAYRQRLIQHILYIQKHGYEEDEFEWDENGSFEVRHGEKVMGGFSDVYVVLIDGGAHNVFYSIPVAKGEAVGLFASDLYRSVKVVNLRGGEVLLDLSC